MIMKCAVPSKCSGFTLLELMVVVAILAILTGVATPSFKGLLAAQRMRGVAFDMTADLLSARSEAIKRGENVILSPESGGWSYGWTVKVVSNSELVSKKSAIGLNVTFLASPSSVTFDQNGRVSSITTATNFSLSDGIRNRCITIDPSGRPKSTLAICTS